MELTELIECCKKIKLMYVEDNTSARIFTLEMLERFFDDISVAVDGEEALELFQKDKFDLIITDINMPKKDGITLIKDINKITSDINFIVLSAHNESGYFDEVDKLGVRGYINKPMPLKDFIDIMTKICYS
jgi:YesN/AraC family two-component response regulator